MGIPGGRSPRHAEHVRQLHGGRPAGSGDNIGSLPGSKAALKNPTPGVAYYIDNGVIGFVPIYDKRHARGSNGYQDIIGYAGFQITNIKGATE